MAKRKKKNTKPSEETQRKPADPGGRSPAQEAVHEAGMITGQLKAKLKNATTTFLDIGALLVQVRDRKLYEPLHDASLEIYANKRLDLCRSSLYGYIRVYEWVKQKHPEWLVRPLKGRVPNLTTISDLMWIDEELAKKDLKPEMKAKLLELEKKALAGKLSRSELQALRKRSRGAKEGVQVAIKYLQRARRQVTQSANPSTLALEHIDAAVNALKNQMVLVTAGLRLDEEPEAQGCTLFFA
jgi:hypothetical protein